MWIGLARKPPVALHHSLIFLQKQPQDREESHFD